MEFSFKKKQNPYLCLIIHTNRRHFVIFLEINLKSSQMKITTAVEIMSTRKQFFFNRSKRN